MKLIIDVSEDVYTRLFDNGIQDTEIATDDICEMARSLRFGTPLPKGHGRLIDADAYIEEINRVFPCQNNDDTNIRRTTEIGIKNAPTIIEADKEEEDEISN